MKGRFGKYLTACLQGKLLLTLKVDKYLPQIIFFFLCATGFIAMSIHIESTLHEREENGNVIEHLRSVSIEKSCELTSLYSVCQVEDMLKEMGSELRLPEEKAIIIK